jgi:NTE family protein
MREHRQSGLEDRRRRLLRPRLAGDAKGVGIVVHDVHRERDY